MVFLERAAREFDSSPGKFGQAAFLVLRLVDLLVSDGASSPNDDLFGYQAAATGRYCNEQLEPGASAERLRDLVRDASYAHRRRDPGLIAPAMMSLAKHLEDISYHAEALDVLATLERKAAGHLSAAHAVGAALQTGRVERKLAHFDAAESAYERGAELARAAGDIASVLLSRIGLANLLWGRGNLAEAERCSREVLRDAAALGVPDVQARAEHAFGVVLGARGQVPDAIPHLWRAFDLYPAEADSLNALFDLGFAFSRLGVVDSAERAMKIVARRGQSRSLVQNAKIELLHCASFRRDRVGFERCRAECEAETPEMLPNIRVDYQLKLGIGFARFGRFDRAAATLQHALQLARAHGLHEFEFRIDRIHTGLAACAAQPSEPAAAEEQPGWTEDLAEVTAALAELPL